MENLSCSYLYTADEVWYSIKKTLRLAPIFGVYIVSHVWLSVPDVPMNPSTLGLNIAGKKGKKGFKSSVIKKKTTVKSNKPDIPETRSPVLENKAKVPHSNSLQY
jgi:hypothetical protein